MPSLRTTCLRTSNILPVASSLSSLSSNEAGRSSVRTDTNKRGLPADYSNTGHHFISGATDLNESNKAHPAENIAMTVTAYSTWQMGLSNDVPLYELIMHVYEIPQLCASPAKESESNLDYRRASGLVYA
jgi:hypothetical protein